MLRFRYRELLPLLGCRGGVLEPVPGPWAALSSSCLNLAKGDWALLAPGEGELQPGDAGLVGDVGVEGREGAFLTRGLTGGDWNLLKNPLPF